MIFTRSWPQLDATNVGDPSAGNRTGLDLGNESWRPQHQVLALHGWGGHHEVFAPLAERRPADFRLWSVDLPGYGRSPAAPGWTIGTVVDELAGVIDRVRSTAPEASLRVVGNCSGGLFALRLAQRLAGRVDALVLIDPFAYTPWYFRIFLAGSFGRRAYQTAFGTRLGRRLTNGALASKRTDDSDLTANFAGVDHRVTYRLLTLIDQDLEPESFADLTLPIVIVHGEKTFAAIRRSVAIWKAVWPQLRTRELAGAGHLPLVEAPDALAAVVFADPPSTLSS